jgi:hypothetical protein
MQGGVSGNPYPPKMCQTVPAMWLDGGNAALCTPMFNQLDKEKEDYEGERRKRKRTGGEMPFIPVGSVGRT